MMDERYRMTESYSGADRFGNYRGYYTFEEKDLMKKKLHEMKNRDRRAYDELMYEFEGTNKHSRGYSEHFTREEAEMAVHRMENVDGTRGEHWSFEQAEKFINAYKLDIPYIEYADFYYLINMFYSDYKRVFEKLGINNTEAYIKFADATINDPDAPEGAIYTKYKSTH